MADPTLVNPVRYDASFETPEDDEAGTTAGMIDTLHGVAQTMADHTGHAMRAVHAKNHGLLRGELHVHPSLPPQLAQGLFARPARYPVLIRLSTPPAEELPDNVSLPRGMAVKVMGVQGERLPGSEADTTQDFVMINGPTFGRPDAKHFLKDLKLVAATTDKSPGGKQFLSALLRGAEAVVEAVGGESAKLKGLGGHPQTHPLGETFFTQLPIRYGDYMAKLSVAPVSPGLTALHEAPLDMKGRPDAMREAVAEFFANAAAPAEWEVRVQLCTDIDRMPIEDASVTWPEDESPYIAVARITVARITVAPQAVPGEQQLHAADDRLAFSPWHGITAHRPLGSLMRVRKAVYAASSDFRAQRNGCPLHEPAGADGWP
jgi:hypothetical protein